MWCDNVGYDAYVKRLKMDNKKLEGNDYIMACEFMGIVSFTVAFLICVGISCGNGNG